MNCNRFFPLVMKFCFYSCFGFLFGIGMLSPDAWSAGWILAQVQGMHGFVYRKPDRQSERVGYYSPGTRLSVYQEPRHGFYAVYFHQLWNGSHYFWVPADSLTFLNPLTSRSEGDELFSQEVSSATVLPALESAYTHWPTRSWFMRVGVGLSRLAFEQTYLPSFTVWNPSVFLDLKRELSPRWSIDSQLFYLSALWRDAASQQGLQVFSSDLQLSYRLTRRHARFSLLSAIGWYYGTTVSKPLGFAYTSVQGPQVALHTGYLFKGGGQFLGWVGFSPLCSFQQTELKWGASYASFGATQRGRGWGLFFDMQQVHLQQNPDRLRVRSYTLGMNYAF